MNTVSVIGEPNGKTRFVNYLRGATVGSSAFTQTKICVETNTGNVILNVIDNTNDTSGSDNVLIFYKKLSPDIENLIERNIHKRIVLCENNELTDNASNDALNVIFAGSNYARVCMGTVYSQERVIQILLEKMLESSTLPIIHNTNGIADRRCVTILLSSYIKH